MGQFLIKSNIFGEDLCMTRMCDMTSVRYDTIRYTILVVPLGVMAHSGGVLTYYILLS